MNFKFQKRKEKSIEGKLIKRNKIQLLHKIYVFTININSLFVQIYTENLFLNFFSLQYFVFDCLL